MDKNASEGDGFRMKPNRFDSLSGLKGLFCLIIVFFHTLPHTPLINRIPLTSIIWNYGGMIGNYFFFLSSGLLLSYGYRHRIGSKTITFKDFLIKRLIKLYPLYLLTNLVSLVCNTIQFGPSAINIKQIVFTILLQNGGGLETVHPYNGPSWFVSALLVCYIVFFFIAYHARNTTQYYCMIAFSVICGYSILSGRWVNPIAFAHHGDSLFCFFIGCALAEIYPCIRPKIHKWLQPVSAVSLVAAMALMLKYGVDIISGDLRVALACFVYPLMIYLALVCKPVIYILNSKPIQFLGKISFSVFLWHFVLYDCFRYSYGYIFPGAQIEEVQYVIYLVLMLLVSTLSNKYLEAWIGKQITKCA